MSPAAEQELIAKKRNTARYFTETRHVAWVLLVATLVFGVFGYMKMPKRKDPFIKIRIAVAVCVWPGASPERVEELVTRRIEEKIAQNAEVEKIESTSRTGVSLVTVTLRENLPVDQIAKTFDDIDLKLRSIRDLPQGALPIEFQKDFGDTSALMLTIASPRARPVEVSLRAKAIVEDLVAARRDAGPGCSAIVLGFPASLNATPMRRVVRTFAAYARASGRAEDVRLLEGPGYFALDGRVRGS
ncbi:MAG: AcrB/AcrD/AcrF family protein, partial [Labilithrix sp.]|nr:AcrB/AcrD/AcrF family protein [Labilithrix sp.]